MQKPEEFLTAIKNIGVICEAKGCVVCQQRKQRGIALVAARDAEWQARVDRLEELAEDVRQWSEAYPTKIFHEPTPEEVRKVCDAVGVPLDCIAAMVLREFTKPWGDRARAALEGGQG